MKKRDLVTVAPEAPTLEALGMMRRHKIGCLPVIENRRLVGIVTAYDFLSLSAEIVEKQLREGELAGERKLEEGRRSGSTFDFQHGRQT